MEWFKKQNIIIKIVLIAFILITGSAVVAGIFGEPTEVVENETTEEETQEPADIEDIEEESTEDNAEETEGVEDEETDNGWDDMKNQDNIIGVSDKDFTELTNSKPSDVRNDNTGNWRITTISENDDILDYALSYYDTHMEDGEVHHIVNFTLNTTTTLNNLGGLLYVDVKEYEDKEEHDASTLGNGMLLKSYVIYPDGDIEEME